MHMVESGGRGWGIAFNESGHRHFLTMEVIQLKVVSKPLHLCFRCSALLLSPEASSNIMVLGSWGREGDVACYTTSCAGLIRYQIHMMSISQSI